MEGVIKRCRWVDVKGGRNVVILYLSLFSGFTYFWCWGRRGDSVHVSRYWDGGSFGIKRTFVKGMELEIEVSLIFRIEEWWAELLGSFVHSARTPTATPSSRNGPSVLSHRPTLVILYIIETTAQ